ncbi:MAG: ECF-type sigma factor, partial [Marinicella sp.]
MNQPEVTVLIEQAAAGEQQALDQLIPVIYPDLKAIAAGLRRKQFDVNATLNTTSLVNEAWLKLKRYGVQANSRKHFFCIAAQAMRQILMNAAKAKKTQKRDMALSSV